MAITFLEPKTDEPAKRPQGRVAVESQPSTCRVAILGFGTVGRAVAEIICSNSHPHLRLTHIYNRNVECKRVTWIPAHVRWTGDVEEVLASDVDVVVELAGGVDPAGDWVRRALLAGKSVVTANKRLMATQGRELLELARKTGQELEYGASVAGGVPVLSGLEQGLAGDRLFRLAGVLNGTCNYILSNMETGGLSFGDALAKAQDLGYAEANPADDVHGADAGCKLAILARCGLGAELRPEEIYSRSIEGIEAADFRYAKRVGCTIRQVSLAEVKDKLLLAAVQPALVPLTSALAQTKDNQNVLVATGVHGGETIFAGRGAGGRPTAVAVVSDLVAISRRRSGGATRGSRELKAYSVSGELDSPYYLRMAVRKRADIVDKITQALLEHDIKVHAVLQKPRGAGSKFPLVLMLEHCRSSILEAALRELTKLGYLLRPPMTLPALS
jgi:homoserine dehydrogenase